MRCDILITHATAPKGRGLLEAMFRGAGRARVDAKVISHGKPREGALLMLYGLGGRDRLDVGMRYVDRLISWDAGYWDRHLSPFHRRYRISFRGFHPTQFVMTGQEPVSDRWRQSGLSIAADHACSGPILLVGNGPKSNAIGADGWAAGMSRELRRKFPGQAIAYRPKPTGRMEAGVDFDSVVTGPIDDELRQASLVVCRHSNVAVDACRLGVPVVCQDGAAAAIYPRTLDEYELQPNFELRQQFLHRLAWWQWSPAECETGVVWNWLERTLPA